MQNTSLNYTDRAFLNYANKFRICDHSDSLTYTSVPISRSNYTFCIEKITEAEAAISLSRCSSKDTYSRVYGQNQAYLNRNRVDIRLRYSNGSQRVNSIYFGYCNETNGPIEVSNLNANKDHIFTAREIYYILASAYEGARNINVPVNHYYSTPTFTVYHLLDNFIKFEAGESDPCFITDLEKHTKYLHIFNKLPKLLEIYNHALYCYSDMIKSSIKTPFPSLVDYLREMWKQGTLPKSDSIVPIYGEIPRTQALSSLIYQA